MGKHNCKTQEKIQSRLIRLRELLKSDFYAHHTTAIMMLPMVRAAIKAQTLEEIDSFFLLAKAIAKMIKTKVSFMPIFALSGNGHFMGSEEWRG